MEEANAGKLKIVGKTSRFELQVEDDEQRFASQKSARRLLRAGVSGIIGHPFADEVNIAEYSDLYKSAGIPEIRPNSTFVATDSLATAQTILSLLPDDHVLARGLGEFAIAKLKAKRIAVICDDTDRSRDLCDQFVRGAVRDTNLAVHRYSVNQEEFYSKLRNEDEYDLAPVLSELRRVRADVIFIATRGLIAGKIVKEGRETGVRAKFIGSAEIQTRGFEDLSGRADGSSAAERTFSGTHSLPVDQMPGWKGFAKKFTKRYGTAPSEYAAYGFDAANILIDSIRTSGSANPQKVLPQLSSIRHRGVTGYISFDFRGRPGESADSN